MACCGGGEPSPANTPNRQQVSDMQSRLGEMQNPVCIKLVKPNCIRFTQYGPVTYRQYLVTSFLPLLVDERDAPQMLGQIDRGQHLYAVSDECVDQDDSEDEALPTSDDSADENSATENAGTDDELPTDDDNADEAPSTGNRGGKRKRRGS